MASLHMSSDVEFLVEGQRLPGHRQVLAKRSEYFRALLCGSMLESRQREVRLEVPLEPFKAILEYLCTGKLPLSSLDVDMLIDVRDLAHFYCLGYVETLITGYLQQKVSVSNVCAILNAAKRCDLEQSIEECQTFMDQNAYDVLKHDSEKHHALRFTDNPNELVIQLRAVFLINQISIWNYNCSHSEIRLEVSCDQTHWDHVNMISAVCHIMRVGITKRAVRYIRVKSCTRLDLSVMAMLVRAPE